MATRARRAQRFRTLSSGPVPTAPVESASLHDALSAVRTRQARQGQVSARSISPRIIKVPADYRAGIVPASDTGAVEWQLWSMWALVLAVVTVWAGESLAKAG